MSSPKLNNLIILGCMLTYFSVVASAIDERGFPEETTDIFCNVSDFKVFDI